MKLLTKSASIPHPLHRVQIQQLQIRSQLGRLAPDTAGAVPFGDVDSLQLKNARPSVRQQQLEVLQRQGREAVLALYADRRGVQLLEPTAEPPLLGDVLEADVKVLQFFQQMN
uniref:(northern house mosquito) hypothetical protein n=1 Tax=Culex pipiens TaxID=7175 RepID=A0A8D8FGF7_CULPI